MAKTNQSENTNQSLGKTLKLMGHDVGHFISQVPHYAHQAAKGVVYGIASTGICFPTMVRRGRDARESGSQKAKDAYGVACGITGVGYFTGSMLTLMYLGNQVGDTGTTYHNEGLIALGATLVATNIASGVYEWYRSAKIRAAGEGLEAKVETSVPEPKI